MRTSQTAAAISQAYQTHRTVSLPEMSSVLLWAPVGRSEKEGRFTLTPTLIFTTLENAVA
jgi:hypothetical protein